MYTGFSCGVQAFGLGISYTPGCLGWVMAAVGYELRCLIRLSKECWGTKWVAFPLWVLRRCHGLFVARAGRGRGFFWDEGWLLGALRLIRWILWVWVAVMCCECPPLARVWCAWVVGGGI